MSVNFDTRADTKPTSNLHHRPTDECRRCGGEIVDADRCKVALEDMTDCSAEVVFGNLCSVCWGEVLDVVCGKETAESFIERQ